MSIKVCKFCYAPMKKVEEKIKKDVYVIVMVCPDCNWGYVESEMIEKRRRRLNRYMEDWIDW